MKEFLRNFPSSLRGKSEELESASPLVRAKGEAESKRGNSPSLSPRLSFSGFFRR